MWIVKLALSRPYTFVVMAMLIVILGGLAVVTMPTDIFPVIDIPIVSVIWNYTGISPEEMEKRIVTSSERAITTTVNDVEHIESQSMAGLAVIRVYFHPQAKVELAVAQLTAISQSILRVLPPGIFPPSIVKYNAASVPILQLSLSSRTLPEQQLYDQGQNFIRTQLAMVPGAAIPIPYGGKPRTIMVDLDPSAMYAKRLSATDVSNAINAQNLIVPAGTAKVGNREYNVRLNASPDTSEALNDLPVRESNGTIVYVRDVAHVRDGYAVQTNVVRENGSRGALLTVLKSGRSSTLDIISRVQETLDKIQAGLPPELKIKRLFDQSVFVRAAISGVVREGIVAAVLTGLMILLFLGSWRSTIIVCISIPLSILTSLCVLYLLGHTINVMTLGGLALAVGILVDDATVEIENIHRNLAEGKPLLKAILDGAQQIAVPTLVSTLSICIVFVPVVFLTGTAQYLFTPLAMAVVFAMLASYLLSRTLVPTLVHYLLPAELDLYQHKASEETDTAHLSLLHRAHIVFERQFERFRDTYTRSLEWALHHRMWVAGIFAVFTAGSFALAFMVGQDFFPEVDAGQFRLHVRTPTGSRIEEAEARFAQVEASIRREIPARELDTILDNIGLPYVGINLAYSDSATVGTGDGEILVALNKADHGPTGEYVKRLRKKLGLEFPDLTFFFQPADITSQILNFGLPAPIDIQVSSRNTKASYQVARLIEQRLSIVPGAADVHLHQITNYPEVRVNVDRSKANVVGLTQRDVANSLLISLSGSGQTAPNFWLNPTNGVTYPVTVQTPQSQVGSFDTLQRTPITSGPSGQLQLLGNLASLDRGVSSAVINHYNVQPVFDVYANVENRDLGGVGRDAQKIIDDIKPTLPQGVTVQMRGQVNTMKSSFLRLGFGLLFAILLVYMLMVVNFQSWLDPFIILMALPGALSGIIWMLFVTQTTFSVPSLMGAIMSIGVATANSILLVTFANDQRAFGYDARKAAYEAGFTRLRPVIMTALAMVIGMLPMSLGLGEGGEQNAPLGRAVIGGLLLATIATLYFVPVVYSVLRRTPPNQDLLNA
jgi:multidrug efflux pump subunit AcrB